jgi:hypothetical protein
MTSALKDPFQSPALEKGVMVQTLNPLTGHTEWKMMAEDYDYQQEVARAAFADMLHDSERVRFLSVFDSVHKRSI